MAKYDRRIPKECLYCREIISLDNDKYCNQICFKLHQKQIKQEKMLAGEDIPTTPKTWKNLVIEINGYICVSCKNDTWMNSPIPLELDHIDGNAENNTVNNLRLLCCNCHALTDTYKAKNKGNGRSFRRKKNLSNSTNTLFS